MRELNNVRSSQAKVLTGGGDLRFAQVDIPFQPFLRLTASLGSMTDT